MVTPKQFFWPISGDFICCHRVEPGVKLYVPREASIPIPLKDIDVTSDTNTSLGVTREKISTIIGTLMVTETCQIRGQGSQYRCQQQCFSVKSIPPNTENWQRKPHDKNYNNATGNEDKHETNYSMNNDTRNMHIT